jgi:hypothetical protein
MKNIIKIADRWLAAPALLLCSVSLLLLAPAPLHGQPVGSSGLIGQSDDWDGNGGWHDGDDWDFDWNDDNDWNDNGGWHDGDDWGSDWNDDDGWHDGSGWSSDWNDSWDRNNRWNAGDHWNKGDRWNEANGPSYDDWLNELSDATAAGLRD